MRLAMRSFTVLFIFLLAAACSGDQSDLPAFREVTPGPGERAVTLADPLEIPPSRSLPAPTPGGTNRADPG
ncbi:MAG: DUF3035 domain-containing protein [Pseudomonadota bacterium]